MAEQITLPTTHQLDARIRACKDELRELQRLRRMVRAAELADQARAEREEVSDASR